MRYEKKTKEQLMDECRETAKSLLEIEQEFSLLVGNIPAMVFKGYADWAVDFRSNRVEEITGYSKADFDSRRFTWAQMILEEDIDLAKKIFIQALKRGQSYVREYRIKRKDGELIWIEERSHIVCDPDGRIEYVSGLFFDITDRVLTEESAAKNREALQEMLMERTYELKRANERLRQAGLYSGEPGPTDSIPSKPVKKGPGVAETEAIMQARLRLAEFTCSHSLEELLRATLDEVEAMTGSKIGFYHFLEADQKTLSLQTWSTGTLREMCTAESSGHHYDLSRAGVWMDCILEHRPVIHNDYSTLPHRKGMPPGHARVIRELVVPVLRGNKIVAILGVGNKPQDYDEKDIKIASVLADLAWDLVERKRAEEKLHESEERFRFLVEDSLTGIVIIQKDRIAYVNPAQKKITGSAVEKDGPLRFDRIHPEDVEKVKTLYSRMTLEEIHAADTTFRFYPISEAQTDQDVKWLYCRASVIEYLGSQGILLNVMDITRMKEMEHLLRIEDKMSSLGRVAAGLAHELRNPVSGITIHLTNLERVCSDLEEGDPEAPGKTREIIADLKFAAERIETVVRRVMDFARSGVTCVAATNINLPIEEAMKLSSASLRQAGIRIEKDLAPNLPECCVDPHFIERVLMNLITNAMQMMQGTERAKIIELRSLAEESYVLIKVSDSGSGVPPHLRDKIFDPFFTTQNSGLGIGLSLCHRIISDHGGTLDVSTSRWGGAEFTIKIPIDKRSGS